MQPSPPIFSECYLGTKCSGSTRTGFRDIGDFLDSLEAWDRAHKVGAPSRSTLTILVWCQDQSDWRRRRIGVPSAPPKLPANKVDRKSAGQGKRVSVRVALGGGR